MRSTTWSETVHRDRITYDRSGVGIRRAIPHLHRLEAVECAFHRGAAIADRIVRFQTQSNLSVGNPWFQTSNYFLVQCVNWCSALSCARVNLCSFDRGRAPLRALRATFFDPADRTHVLTLIPSRPLSNRTWPICYEIDRARCLHRDLSWTTNIDQGG